MAAAIIPIIAALAPDIIGLIAGLVHKAAPAAEETGPGTGPVKFAQVFQTVIQALNAAAEAGQIPKALPSDESIKVVIQAVVSSMKLSGLLDSSTPTPAIGPAAITVKAGQTITITGV